MRTAVKPITRDYKRPRRRSIDLAARWREFALGLGVGLLIAVVVFLYQRQALREIAGDKPRPERRAAGADGSRPETSADLSAQDYDFYEMLPKFEVVVPEKDREVRRDQPNSPVERPGVYVLQAGSYRNQADAERVRAQLALQNVQATVQRVAIDSDVWHRVRIGPLTDLNEVNRLRARLRAADLNALVIRVGE